MQMKTIGKSCAALAVGLLAIGGGMKGCEAYQNHKTDVRAQEWTDQYIKTFKADAWAIDPKTGKKIVSDCVTDTIYTKDIHIADSLIKEGQKINVKEFPKLDSIMQTNYAKGLLSVDTVKKAAKTIK